MILETGDEMQKSTNVKADMTNWTMHKTHTGFKQLADIVISIVVNLQKLNHHSIHQSVGQLSMVRVKKQKNTITGLICGVGVTM